MWRCYKIFCHCVSPEVLVQWLNCYSLLLVVFFLLFVMMPTVTSCRVQRGYRKGVVAFLPSLGWTCFGFPQGIFLPPIRISLAASEEVWTQGILAQQDSAEPMEQAFPVSAEQLQLEVWFLSVKWLRTTFLRDGRFILKLLSSKTQELWSWWNNCTLVTGIQFCVWYWSVLP